MLKLFRSPLSRIGAAAAATLLTLTFATLTMHSTALAQDEDVASIFATAPQKATSVPGVTLFAGPPAHFNPLTASNRELLTYGLPARPDKLAEPEAYAVWERAMLAATTRAVDVHPLPLYSTEIHNLQVTPGSAVSATNATSENWSGVASTNSLKSWSSSTSFNKVVSVWNVPAAQPPFGACKAGITGPFYEVSWNGIDGLFNGDVVQGGSYSYSDCSSKRTYLGWVEWYPSYPILSIDCIGSTPCPVSPGDDFYVITYGVTGNTQHVFVEDITQQWSGTFKLTYVSGPALVGNSAEYIVERPGLSSGYAPLANTIFDFFADSSATDGAKTVFYPGSNNSATYNITMLADNLKTKIEAVSNGTTGTQGLGSLWFETINCAYKGGCTP